METQIQPPVSPWTHSCVHTETLSIPHREAAHGRERQGSNWDTSETGHSKGALSPEGPVTASLRLQQHMTKP